MKRFSRFLTRKPWLVLLCAAVLSILSAFGYLATRVNYDILSYLPQDLESTEGVNLLEDPFHMAATSMLVIDDMPPAYTAELVDEIKAVDGVSDVIWLSDIMGIQIPKEMLPARLRDTFFSDTGTMLLIRFERSSSSDETLAAIGSIRSLCNEKCFLSGFSALIRDTRDLVNREMPVYILVAVLLSMAAMMLTLESFLLPAALMLNIVFAVILNFGTNFFLGEISYVTQAIAAILQLGVTMDYSIFLYDRYREEMRLHEDRRDAMAEAIVAAMRSLTGSSLTTVAGFLALCFMRLTLGRDIGIVMAKGVVMAILSVITVLPSIILVMDRGIRKTEHRPLLPDFTGFNRKILGLRALIAVMGLVLVVPALYSQQHMTMYYKIDESLPESLPSKVASAKLKEDYGMVSSHYVVMREDLGDEKMHAMIDELESVEGVENIVSYYSLLGSGMPDFFVPDSIRKILKNGPYQLLMINSNYELATDEMGIQLRAIDTILKKYDPEAKLSGESAMTQDLITTADTDFRVTNYISMAAIFLIIALTFRSISIPVILVMTIELAICINEGIPYFTGSPVAFVTPTVISAIQLGATVDYAILMTTRFQEEIRGGKDRKEAIIAAGAASDPSIITSALVMFCATIGVSLVCSIDMVTSICLMLARGAIISALISILLLPVLLYLCEPLIRKTTLSWAEAPGKRRAGPGQKALEKAEELVKGKRE